MSNWWLLLILFIFMFMSFIAGIYFALWVTDPRKVRIRQDRLWARQYDLKD